MWAFLVIHLFDKMTDAIPRLGDVLILIEVNFFLFEGANEAFCLFYLKTRELLSVNCQLFTEPTLIFSFYARNPLKTAVFIMKVLRSRH